MLKSINPYNNQLLKEYKEFDDDQINSTLEKSYTAFIEWRNTSFEERSKLMKNASAILLKRKNELAEFITVEMGKPILQSVSEIEKCAVCCDYFAENLEQFLKSETIKSDASKSFVSYEPLGPVFAIMPWNFPFWQVFRFAAPSLMAGNVGLLKHASNVTGCSLAIENIFKEAGFPENVFISLPISSGKVKLVIENQFIKAVTLTGSEFAGSEVAMVAGKNLKKTVLELGGSDAFIVLKDANVEEAADVAVKSRLISNGQSCIAAKRFIVVEEVYDEFLNLFKNKFTQLKIGNPMDKEIDLGPLARADLVKGLMKQVEDSVNKGAKIFYKGKAGDKGDCYMNPMILTDVKPGMPAYDEELFGPVASVFKAENENQAIRIANDTKFGLGASIWTKDTERGILLAGKIESGSVFINGLVKSDPRLPFGGIKSSGYGRELSYLGIKEFVNAKTVWVK